MSYALSAAVSSAPIITAYSTKLGLYRVATTGGAVLTKGPVKPTLSKEALFSKLSSTTTMSKGLSAAVPYSSSPSKYVEIASQATKPAGAAEVTEAMFDRAIGLAPWYKRWWGMAAIAGGAVVVGTGVLLLLRRPST